MGVAAFLPSQTKIGPPPAEMTCNPRNTVPFFHHSFQRTKRSEFAVKADAAAAACLNDPCAGSRPNGANDRLKRSPSVAPPATFSPSAQITTVVFCRVDSKLSRVVICRVLFKLKTPRVIICGGFPFFSAIYQPASAGEQSGQPLICGIFIPWRWM